MFWEIDYIMFWEIGSIIFIYQISQNMYIPPLPRSSLRPLRGSAIHSSAASHVLIRRPFLSLWFILSERLITLYLIWLCLRDWIHYFYLSNLSEHVYSSAPPLIASSAARLRDSLLRCFACPHTATFFYPFNSSCLRDWLHYVWEIDWIIFDYVWEIDWIIFIYQISQNMYIPPSILTPRLRRLLRPLRGSAIHSSAASPVLSYGNLFYPFNSSCMRDWLHYGWLINYIIFDLIMFEILITLCYERLITLCYERLITLCYERLDPLFLFIKSLRTCIFLRLFLPRDFVACFACTFLRR